MNFSTDSQRDLFKMVLKATAMYPDGVPAHAIVENAQHEGVYKNAGSASKQLKNWVADDEIPIDRQGDLLFRTDMEAESGD